MPFLVKFLLLLSFFYISVSAKETNNITTLEDVKAHYILQTFKHLNGLKENTDGHYILGIYGKAQELIFSFNKKLSTSTLSKKIIVESIGDPHSVEHFTAIFVTKKNIASIKAINERYPKALVITDGHVNRKQQMVSLVVKKGQVSLNINRQNLLTRGFKISNAMLNFAGNREDLSSRLLAQENYLKTLLLNSREQEKKLVKLNQQHQLSNNRLNNIKIELNDKIIQLQENEDKLLQEQSQLKQLQQQQKHA